jgi:hypothetical protein
VNVVDPIARASFSPGYGECKPQQIYSLIAKRAMAVPDYSTHSTMMSLVEEADNKSVGKIVEGRELYKIRFEP